MDLSLDIPESAWRQGGDNNSLLRCTITINGCDLHLEAHAVKWKEHGENAEGQLQVNDGEDSDFEELHFAFGGGDPQQEVSIRGRQYVLFADAFGT